MVGPAHCLHQDMAFLAAHMGDVNHRQGIAGQDPDAGAWGKAFKPLARHQGWKRAFEAAQVEFFFHLLILRRRSVQHKLMAGRAHESCRRDQA